MKNNLVDSEEVGEYRANVCKYQDSPRMALLP